MALSFNLGTNKWISLGANGGVYVTFSYNKRRNGSNMEYQIQAQLEPLTGFYYYGYPIQLTISLDGTQKLVYTLKNSSPSQWSSPIVYTSGWLSVANKVTGTTAAALRVQGLSGGSGDSTYNYSLAIDGAPSTFTVSKSSISMSGSDGATVNISRSSSSFTHTVIISLGSYNLTYTNISTSKAFIIPITWNNAVKTYTSGTGVVTVHTYLSGSLVGTTTKNITLTVPTNIVPSMTSFTATRVDGTVPTDWNVYVQNKSSVTLKINGPAGSYGSTIKSYSITGPSVSSTASSGTFAVKNSGTLTFTAKVTDTRGRTATKTVQISVEAYSSPYLLNGSYIRRANSENESDPTGGTSLQAYIKGAISSVSGKNVKLLRIRYKLKTETTYSAFTTVQDSTLTLLYDTLIDISKEYDVQLYVGDSFTNISYMFDIGTVNRSLNINSSLNSVCIGGFASIANSFESKKPAIFTAGIAPQYIAAGSDLNDYITPGTTFYCNANSVASQIANTPVNLAFSLEIVRDASVTQIFTTYTGIKYIRSYYLGWNEWVPLTNVSGTWTPYRVNAGAFTVSTIYESNYVYNNNMFEFMLRASLAVGSGHVRMDVTGLPSTFTVNRNYAPISCDMLGTFVSGVEPAGGMLFGRGFIPRVMRTNSAGQKYLDYMYSDDLVNKSPTLTAHCVKTQEILTS